MISKPAINHSTELLSWQICLGILAAAILLLAPANDAGAKEQKDGLSWEMPGRLSIYDLQFGPAVLKDSRWKFLGNRRRLDASRFPERLTLMVRFSYNSSRSGTPLKFVIKLPQSRQYEEVVHLGNRQGRFVYKFTIHHPDEFIGSGSVYLYYGFSIVDMFDFTIVAGS